MEQMEQDYRVIALDMDGTVLDDRKQMGERTKQAIHKALAAGKEVIFCTGRSFAEMEDILKEFPDMHYLCGESGALIYDLRENRPVKMVSMPKAVVADLVEAVRDKDVMPQVFSEGRCYVNRTQLPRMDYYQMGVYQEAFNRACTVSDDVWQTALEKSSIEKFNLFHTSVEDREKTFRMLKEKNLEATMVYSEISSLECSALGLSKAVGLQSVCEILDISIQEVIMVGDADNDLEGLKAAGLAVAMGNANERVKAVSDVVVADNNHDGCAEAIERYLLKK